MGTAECEFPDIMYINTEDVSVASKIKIRKFKAMYRNYSKKKKIVPVLQMVMDGKMNGGQQTGKCWIGRDSLFLF